MRTAPENPSCRAVAPSTTAPPEHAGLREAPDRGEHRRLARHPRTTHPPQPDPARLQARRQRPALIEYQPNLAAHQPNDLAGPELPTWPTPTRPTGAFAPVDVLQVPLGVAAIAIVLAVGRTWMWRSSSESMSGASVELGISHTKN